MSLGSAVSGFLGGQNDYTASNPYANEEQSLATMLANQANGQGPNPAALQFQQGVNQISQNAATVNANNRAISPGLAARLSAQTAATQGQNAAAGMGALTAQQQIAAENQEGGVLNNMSMQNLGAEQINASAAQNNANNAQSAGAGLINGIASGIGSLFAKGGLVKGIQRYADGGTVQLPNFYLPVSPVKPVNFGGFGSLGSALAGGPGAGFTKSANGVISNTSQGMDQTGANIMTNDIPAAAAPSLVVAPAAPAAAAAAPGLGVDASALAADPALLAMVAAAKGGRIPGKAKVPGDSYKNDTVPAMLSPGEVVLDRKVMGSKNPPEAAKSFVKELMEKEEQKKQKYARGGRVTVGHGLSAVLQAQASLHDRMKKLEKKGAA